MPAQRRLTRNTIIQFPTLTQFWSILIISVCLQLIIAVSFGHDYDMRIFMATGYLVATGENPYNPQDLTSVFNDSGFQGMTSVGYLPPWPLVLGFIYLIVYQLIPNFFLYNLAIKIPIIAANIGLAFLVIKILERLDAGRKAIRGAWIFMLLNPFVLYFSTSWGQINSIVALLSLYSLLLLYTGKSNGAAITLALAISIKPTALPFFIVTFIYLARKSHAMQPVIRSFFW